MAHRLSFDGFEENFDGTLSPEEATDFVDLLFVHPDTSFHIVGRKKSPGMLGRHEYGHLGPAHTISLFSHNIARCFVAGIPIGGNAFPAKDTKSAVLQTFAHEIQHANQAAARRGRRDPVFYAGRYRTRPCEVDARRFVDENIKTIWTFAGLDVPLREAPPADLFVSEVEAIADIFSEEKRVERGDLVIELRASGIYNVKSLALVESILMEDGVKIVGRKAGRAHPTRDE